jgi:crotonobetainyl-CoA:carnitine CoA-transferase CaiB-like acyl-CoA transferase
MAPLTGIRVLDLSTTLLGPYCTLLMAQLGADVIKVEAPSGDVTRQLGPRRSDHMSAVFLSLNAGKRSIILDLKRERPRAALDRLIVNSDVFIHNMRRDAALRLRLDDGAVCAINPRLVYCAASGYGPGGPYDGRAAYDDIIQAISGVAALQGHAEGVPRYVATVIADKTAGLTAMYAITAALLQRERTGLGQAIEVPMFETMSAFLLAEQMYGAVFVPAIGGPVYQRTVSPYRRPYATKDGYIAVVPYTDDQWHRFFDILDRPDLKDDPAFVTFTARAENVDKLYRFLAETLLTRDTATWMDMLLDADIPATQVNAVSDLLDDAHLNSVGLIRTVEHPTEGLIRSVANPVRFASGESHALFPAPRLGEHSEAILREAGYGPEEIQEIISGSSPAPGIR